MLLRVGVFLASWSALCSAFLLPCTGPPTLRPVHGIRGERTHSHCALGAVASLNGLDGHMTRASALRAMGMATLVGGGSLMAAPANAGTVMVGGSAVAAEEEILDDEAYEGNIPCVCVCL